jgi:hypothetical protein
VFRRRPGWKNRGLRVGPTDQGPRQSAGQVGPVVVLAFRVGTELAVEKTTREWLLLLPVVVAHRAFDPLALAAALPAGVECGVQLCKLALLLVR